jgi:hypothetical protein
MVVLLPELTPPDAPLEEVPPFEPILIFTLASG